MSPAASSSNIFKGDDASMVDRLVDLCEAQKRCSPTSSTYTGFGRELVPYFEAGAELPALPNNTARQPKNNSKSCGASPNRGGSARTSPGKNSSPDNLASKRRTSGAGRKPRHGSPTQESSAIAAGTPPPAQAALPRRQFASSTSLSSGGGAVACPGLFSASPKPEALPMPPSFLFRRAASVKNLDGNMDSKETKREAFAALLSAAMIVPPAAA